jgi:hypothetical protein
MAPQAALKTEKIAGPETSPDAANFVFSRESTEGLPLQVRPRHLQLPIYRKIATFQTKSIKEFDRTR